MKEIKKELLSLGYSEEEASEIINNYSIINLRPETLLKKIHENMNFFKSIGYSQEEVIKMTKVLPAIYGYSIENIKQKIEDMKELGYSC